MRERLSNRRGLELADLPFGLRYGLADAAPYPAGTRAGTEMLARQRVRLQQMIHRGLLRALAFQQRRAAAEAEFYVLLGAVYALSGGARAGTEQDEHVPQVLVDLYQDLLGGDSFGAHWAALPS